MIGRYIVWLVLALLTLFTLGFNTSAPLRASTVTGVAFPYLYSLPGWEVRHFLGKWLYLLERPFRGGAPTEAEARVQVREFFRLGEQMATAQGELERAAARRDEAGRQSAQARLKGLEAQRAALQPRVEAILEAEIGRVLAAEGLTARLGPWRPVFPPVDFTFSRSPYLLAVSPRERIYLLQTLLLTSDLPLERQEGIEAGVEALGLSAVTERTGGVATYPSIISEFDSLEGSLITAAHEWMHQYLAIRPLGRNYRANSEMTTVNETLTDIAGQEVGRRALRRIFPELAPPEPPPSHPQGQPPPEGQPEPPAPGAFDFNREMRLTRLTVEEMLARGEIEPAEAYMRQRQEFLAQHGYFIRKLNQAYFAWHGTYADSPASVSPVAGLLRRLREQSPSLGAFVRKVAGVSSYEEFLALVGEQP